MLEEIAMQLRDKMDELFKELLSSAGIEVNESDLRNMAEFKSRLEKDGYEITTWSEGDRSFYKLTRFGEGITILESWTEYDFGSEKSSAKLKYKFTSVR